MTKRQVIALGGGGFSMEPYNPLLDLYILSQCEKLKPKVCFIGTASGDAQGYIDRFYASFKKYYCTPSHLSLFRGDTAKIEEFILEQDIIYVGGGNTRNLLTLWKDWKLDLALRKAYERGTIMAGISAGSICWFEQGVTDSVPGMLSSLNCLGFLPGSNCPHYDGESQRRPSYHQLLKNKEIKPGIATDDGVAAHYINESVFQFVSSHPEKAAFSVGMKDDNPNEEKLPVKYIGGKALLIRRAALSDAEAIHFAHMKSIQQVCAKDYTKEQIQAWGGRPYREEQRHKHIKEQFVWVIEDQGQIEGYGLLALQEANGKKIGEVQGLYLTLKVIGQSLGKKVFSLMLEKAKELGMTQLILDSTLTSREFYKKLGFKDNNSITSHEIAGVGIPCYHMEMAI